MMYDCLLTAALIMFLICGVLYKIRYCPEGNAGCFNTDNTKGMRGFWSIVIVLVHTPLLYQNRLQDLIGSFAYIGVTFFFLVSSFGLTLRLSKEDGKVERFWRNRLLKLLIPQVVSNVIFAILFSFILGQEISPGKLVAINPWVLWLLVCYFIYWGTDQLLHNSNWRTIILYGLIILFSLMAYCGQRSGMIEGAIWSTEIWGFIWGSVLALNFRRIISVVNTSWLWKVIAIGATVCVLGILYVLNKSVFFAGDYLLKITLGLGMMVLVLFLNVRVHLGNDLMFFLGDISYEIYLIHANVFVLIASLFPKMRSGEYIIISVAVTIILAYVTHQIAGGIQKGISRLLKI